MLPFLGCLPTSHGHAAFSHLLLKWTLHEPNVGEPMACQASIRTRSVFTSLQFAIGALQHSDLAATLSGKIHPSPPLPPDTLATSATPAPQVGDQPTQLQVGGALACSAGMV